jgi:iron(III) transport system ATP-binding protein
MTLVAIRGLSKRYGRTVALDAVDLDIPHEGRTAVVGASGSGKTTLLRLIAGFERPDAGSIVFAGMTLADDTAFIPAHHRGIGYVSQDGALFPHMSVGANVGFAIPRNDPGRQARIAELLELVQLDPAVANRRPHELSGGQQQRVALARALALRPKLVLLDEPFSALDAGLRESLRNAVADVLAGARVSTVLVSHDQGEALSFATHLAVLQEGRLAQSGPPRELYGAPSDRAVAEFLGDAVVLEAVIGDGWAECALGRIPVSPTTRRGKGTILIRPEQLTLTPIPAGATSAGATAVVAGVSFVGAASAVRLAWADGGGSGSFTCRLPGPPPQVGDRFSVTMTGEAHALG